MIKVMRPPNMPPENVPPRKVYRYFSDERFADTLCSGHVWLGTLEDCRKKEESRGGDPGEAEHFHDIDYLEGGRTPREEITTVLGRAGLPTKLGMGSVIGWSTVRSVLTDAYVLCTTDQCDDAMAAKFGRHCVEIDRSEELFGAIGERLWAFGVRGPMRFGRIVYHDRTIQQDDSLKTPPVGFLKEPRFAHEREWRMLYLPSRPGQTLTPFLLKNIPAARELCRRIS